MLQTRLELQEQRQNQMMQFLSKALQRPTMLQQLVASRQNIQRIANGCNSAHHGTFSPDQHLPSIEHECFNCREVGVRM